MRNIADFRLPIADWSDGGSSALMWQLNADQRIRNRVGRGDRKLAIGNWQLAM